MIFEEMLSFGRNILDEVEPPVLNESKREEPHFHRDFSVDPNKIKKYGISQKSENATPDIPEKIVKTIENRVAEVHGNRTHLTGY